MLTNQLTPSAGAAAALVASLVPNNWLIWHWRKQRGHL